MHEAQCSEYTKFGTESLLFREFRRKIDVLNMCIFSIINMWLFVGKLKLPLPITPLLQWRLA